MDMHRQATQTRGPIMQSASTGRTGTEPGVLLLAAQSQNRDKTILNRQRSRINRLSEHLQVLPIEHTHAGRVGLGSPAGLHYAQNNSGALLAVHQDGYSPMLCHERRPLLRGHRSMPQRSSDPSCSRANQHAFLSNISAARQRKRHRDRAGELPLMQMHYMRTM